MSRTHCPDRRSDNIPPARGSRPRPRFGRGNRPGLGAPLGAAALVAAMVGVTAPADGYAFMGCRFAEDDPRISYRLRTGPDIGADVTAAIESWNSKRNVPGTFVPGSPTTPPGSAAVTIAEVASILDAWAWVGSPSSAPPRCLGGSVRPYDRNRTQVHLNTNTVSLLPPEQRRLVATHELGHVLGLGHVARGCGDRPSVMVQGSAKWECDWRGRAPWADDAAGVRALYRASRNG